MCDAVASLCARPPGTGGAWRVSTRWPRRSPACPGLARSVPLRATGGSRLRYGDGAPYGTGAPFGTLRHRAGGRCARAGAAPQTTRCLPAPVPEPSLAPLRPPLRYAGPPSAPTLHYTAARGLRQLPLRCGRPPGTGSAWQVSTLAGRPASTSADYSRGGAARRQVRLEAAQARARPRLVDCRPPRASGRQSTRRERQTGTGAGTGPGPEHRNTNAWPNATTRLLPQSQHHEQQPIELLCKATARIRSRSFEHRTAKTATAHPNSRLAYRCETLALPQEETEGQRQRGLPRGPFGFSQGRPTLPGRTDETLRRHVNRLRLTMLPHATVAAARPGRVGREIRNRTNLTTDARHCTVYHENQARCQGYEIS